MIEYNLMSRHCELKDRWLNLEPGERGWEGKGKEARTVQYIQGRAKLPMCVCVSVKNALR